MLLIAATHPIQYHAPVFDAVAERLGRKKLLVVYGSDFSLAGYQDDEFSCDVSWAADLLAGHSHRFLSREPGTSYETVTARGLSDTLAEVKPTIGLSQGYSVRFDRQAIARFRRAQVPWMMRSEANDQAFSRGPFKQVLRDCYLRSLYRSASAFLAIGTRAREHYIRRGVPASKIFFSPYCSPLDAPVPDATTGGRYRVLYCGKLVERKGVEGMPAALARLRRHHGLDAELVVAGDGELKASVQAECKRLGVALNLLGFADQETLPAIYRAADCLLLPSLRGETWGVVANESLAQGRPVVLSDRVGSAPDLVKEGVTGASFKAGDADGMADALAVALKISRDPVTEEACRSRAALYSVARAADGICQAYEYVASATGGRGS